MQFAGTPDLAARLADRCLRGIRNEDGSYNDIFGFQHLEPDQSDRSSVKLNIAPDRSQFPQRGQSTLMISLYALNLSVVACFELESDLLLHVESWKGELTK